MTTDYRLAQAYADQFQEYKDAINGVIDLEELYNEVIGEVVNDPNSGYYQKQEEIDLLIQNVGGIGVKELKGWLKNPQDIKRPTPDMIFTGKEDYHISEKNNLNKRPTKHLNYGEP